MLPWVKRGNLPPRNPPTPKYCKDCFTKPFPVKRLKRLTSYSGKKLTCWPKTHYDRKEVDFLTLIPNLVATLNNSIKFSTSLKLQWSRHPKVFGRGTHGKTARRMYGMQMANKISPTLQNTFKMDQIGASLRAKPWKGIQLRKSFTSGI